MTENKFSIIDLGKLSKPISKLIESVSLCIGTLYEPTKIRRKAKAQADAALIKAEADIKKKELLQRAVNRFAFQEISRQENIENIIEIAAASLPEKVSEDPVDKDWMSRFFDDCKDVSNEDLQKLWGRLLAGEVSSPGYCSRKTLAILRDLSAKDGNLFKIMGNFLWSMQQEYVIPYFPDIGACVYLDKYNIKYNDLLQLDALGLIHSNLNILIDLTYGEEIDYFDNKHICYWEPKNLTQSINVFPLTKSGIELLSVLNNEINSLYYADVIMMFSDYLGIFLACPLYKLY
jgi:hypothetical protein